LPWETGKNRPFLSKTAISTWPALQRYPAPDQELGAKEKTLLFTGIRKVNFKLDRG